ncbi:MAG: AAA family ATPase [Phormidesmis sp. CAN_BIN44]|nr:AAA family ATPase [Phormidesmis sp. CAN_BIN44]
MASKLDPVENLLLPNLALKGYRSFGPQWQRFSHLGKVTLLIGQNNCGKSNVLRFIHDWLAGMLGQSKKSVLGDHDKHLPDRGPVGYAFRMDPKRAKESIGDPQAQHLDQPSLDMIKQVLLAKATLDKDPEGPWFYFNERNEMDETTWPAAFKDIDDSLLKSTWGALCRMKGGDRNLWVNETIKKLAISRPNLSVALVPAIRMVGKKDSTSEDFSGDGIIERLAKLQNPSVFEQSNRERFDQIVAFLQTVTDNPTARIEIPYERNTILVHMDQKVLPLESLGSGIHEVIILAAAATILENSVVCMEEPELHLNPILQKKLLRYLLDKTSNQYFITTHSAALMDTPGAEVYHITLQNGCSLVERVTSDRHRSDVCHDLGYHPSDLLQTNSIVWVEGPSDRIYVNWWIKSIDRTLIEGIHYSVMFYGGRLASHLSADGELDAVEEFISLRRLNRRGTILIDSDRASKGARLNDTKSRLRAEFETGPGHAWVTEGREIENYIAPALLTKAVQKIHPSSTLANKLGKYENAMTIKGRGGKPKQASKVAVANAVVSFGPPDLSCYDLKHQVKRLVIFIRLANPG